MKKSVSKNFIDVLLDNNEEEMREYLLLNGKKPKPISPFYFIKEEVVNDKSEK